MTTRTRILLTHLRLDAANILDTGGTDHGKALVDPDDLVALLEAVEAAHVFTRRFAELGPIADTAHALQRALDRFDFGDTT